MSNIKIRKLRLPLGLASAWLVAILATATAVFARATYAPGSAAEQATLGGHYGWMLKYHSTIDPFVRDGSIVFIGDSIVQGLNTDAVTASIAPSVNYGIGGDTTEGVVYRLPIYHSLGRASTVVLAVGVNDLYQRSIDEVIATYRAILDTVPTGPRVVVSAVLPVHESSDRDRLGWNTRIVKLNTALRGLISSCSRCTFVDSAAAVRDSDGELDNRFDAGDGLHLNADGYRAWVTQLKTVI